MNIAGNRARDACGEGGIEKLPMVKDQLVSWLLANVQVLNTEFVCLNQNIIFPPNSPQPLFSISQSPNTGELVVGFS